MTIPKLKATIEAIYTALAAMVTAGKITEADKTQLGCVILTALLSRESIEG